MIAKRVAAPSARAKFMAGTAMVLLGTSLAPMAARAQLVPVPMEPNNFTSTSTTDALQFVAPVITNQTASATITQLLGTLNGGTPLYDESFDAAFASASVQQGVAAAKAAITSAGGPGVIIGNPVLVSSSNAVSESSVSTYTLDPTQPAQSFVVTTNYGPGPVLIGNQTSCGAAVAALPSTTKPVCGTPAAGTTATLLPGQVDTNVATNTVYLIDTATTTTATTTTTDVYQINGTTESLTVASPSTATQAAVVQPLGTAHAAAPQAGFSQADDFSRRLLDAGQDGYAPANPQFADIAFSDAATRPASSPWHGFAESYGYVANSGESGGTPGYNGSTLGFHGGIGYDVSPAWRLGAAFDYGETDIAQAAVNETAKISLTDFGLYAAWHDGAKFVTIAGVQGYGNAKTESSPQGIGYTATGKYNLVVQNVAVEAGVHLPIRAVVLTPSIGTDYTHVHAGAFTETGSPLDLAGPSDNYQQFSGWAGMSAETLLDLRGNTLALQADGRLIATGGDRRIDVPVNFVGSTTSLTITGTKTGVFGGDLGTAAAYFIGHNAKLYLAYNAQFRGGTTAQSGTGGVAITF